MLGAILLEPTKYNTIAIVIFGISFTYSMLIVGIGSIILVITLMIGLSTC